jgi:hypothetical protein
MAINVIPRKNTVIAVPEPTKNPNDWCWMIIGCWIIGGFVGFKGEVGFSLSALVVIGSIDFLFNSFVP